MTQDAAPNPITADQLSDAFAADAERAARRLFQRTLACWVSDLLHLRREGLIGSGAEASGGTKKLAA